MLKARISIMAGFLLLLLLIAGCNRPVPGSKLPSSTPLPSTAEPLSLTRTSLAGQIMATLTSAGITPNQPQATAPVETATIETTSPSGTGPVAPSSTAPAVTIVAQSPQPSATPTIHSVAPSAPTAAVPQMVSVYPQVYTLHRGEFPWCLARRFDVNPRQLLAVNGFYVWQIFYTGQQVYFPNNPMPFPGRRALRPHPASYRVAPGNTIYSIACFFGDVDPIYMAEINGISPPYRLTAGQVLSIP